ncbi:MAG: hypothetical protein K5793_09740 [Nitrosarchaeum sp.]|nr:hypothetical protein [Nitrosarchaeum sp.]MCV0399292.1 hypothetical protein [Nitrosarchaeum sp.]
MNKNTGILFLGTAIALGLGAFGISNSFGTNDASTLDSSSFMVGHLTLTAHDENGNIKQYIQTDNVVLNTADNCISEKLFTLTSGNGCTLSDNYNHIHIGTGSDSSTAEADADPLPITWTAAATASSIVLTNATGTGGASTVLTATFNNVNANIDEAAIRNSVTQGAGNALAYQQFTEIVLGSTDDLTVEWTVTIDGN